MAKKKETRGRKPLDEANRKQEVRFFLETRLINALGGMGDCKKIGVELLSVRAIDELEKTEKDF